MTKPAFTSVPVDEETLEAIDHVLTHWGEDRLSFAANVLKRLAKDELSAFSA